MCVRTGQMDFIAAVVGGPSRPLAFTAIDREVPDACIERGELVAGLRSDRR